MRSPFRSALLFPLLLALTGAWLLAGCGDDGDQAARTSDERPSSDADSTTRESTDQDEQGSDDPEPGDSGDPGDNGETDSDSSIPGLDDLEEAIPPLGELGDCLEIAAAYGSLYFEALGGGEGADNAKEKAEELKEVLPEDLHDDIDVIAAAIGQVAEEGLFNGSEALDTPEYQTADEAITSYLNEQCDGAGA